MHNLLHGLRVVEIGHILNGPLAGQVLGDFGADVIKVEPLGGDVYRHAGASRNPGMGAAWQATNRNKRSIAVDLKTDEGKQILTKLLANADAMIHNLRVNAVKRLGFDYAAVKKIRPQIVYAYSVGYGQQGPYADLPAIDDLIQARSGIAWLNKTANGEPRLVPMVVADTMSAQMLGQSVLAGLLNQQKTGEGCCLEVPMYETVTSLMFSQHLQGQAYVPATTDFGYPRVMSEHRRPCKTLDGFVVHGIYQRAQWLKFFAAIDRNDLVESDMLRDDQSTAANIATLYGIMANEVLPTRTSAQWLSFFGELDLACAPVSSFEDLDRDPHLSSVGLFREFEHPTEGSMREMRFPVSVTGPAPENDLPPPTIGEHTELILTELGYSDTEVKALRGSAVIPAN
jgi:formyl-CoA transferase